jgi:cytochrome P450
LPDCLDSLAEEAAKAKWTYLEFLDQLLTAEIAARTERDITMKTKLARFPFVKTLEQFDFAYQPSLNERQIKESATLRFVAQGENVLFLGPPGAGKTHLAIALGVRAISQGVSVSFVSLADLLDQLHKDAKEDRLSHRLQVLCRPKLLSLDEMGYFPLAEIAERRHRPDPDAHDVLSLLLEARDEDSTGLSDEEIRDQVMTLMFAGHDTSTSTLSFLVHELARNPRALREVQAEQDRVLGDRVPSAAELVRELPYLEMALDETLRLYPPAWIGPRRAVRDFEFAGCSVPAGAHVNYCSWASHRIPEVFPDPETFLPERFERERKAALPRGAYVPFGGGQRICIGKRFGQTEVKMVATLLLQRLRLEHLPGHAVSVRQMPTLSPDGGLPMRIRNRDVELPV